MSETRLENPVSPDWDIAPVARGGGLLLLGLRAPNKSYPNCWDIFGGGVEAGESLDDALRRELREELCIEPQVWKHHSSHTSDGIELHLFTVEAWTGTPRIGDAEHVQIKWLTYADAASLPDLASSRYQAVFHSLCQNADVIPSCQMCSVRLTEAPVAASKTASPS